MDNSFYKNIYHIYALADPEGGIVIYIGKSKNPKKRFEQHLNKPSSLIENWIFTLSKSNKQPLLIILESVEKEHSNVKEKEYIEKYRNNSLFNIIHNDKNSVVHLKNIIKQKDQEINKLKNIINTISGVKGFSKIINEIKKSQREEIINDIIKDIKNELIILQGSKLYKNKK